MEPLSPKPPPSFAFERLPEAMEHALDRRIASAVSPPLLALSSSRDVEASTKISHVTSLESIGSTTSKKGSIDIDALLRDVKLLVDQACHQIPDPSFDSTSPPPAPGASIALSPTSRTGTSTAAASAGSEISGEKLIESLGDRKILVTTERRVGLGSVSCMLKIATLLHEQLHIPSDQIVVSCIDTPESVAIFNTKYNFPTSLSEADEENLAACIVAPCERSLFYERPCPTLYIPQYDYPPETNAVPPRREEDGEGTCGSISWLTMGFSKEVGGGILISDELVEWGFSEPKPSETRVRLLTELSPEISTTIFKCLPEELELSETTTSFDEHNRLYYGYATSPKVCCDYIEAIAKVDRDKIPSKNITIVLPGNHLEDFGLPNLLPSRKAELIAQGIGSIELIRPGEPPTIITLDPSLSKTLTIISGPISYSDTTLLLKASEKEVLITGDQSLSEAISVNKTFIYETHTHKETFAAGINTEFQKSTGVHTRITTFKGSTSSDMYSVFSTCRETPIFERFNRHIVENRNCNHTIADRVKLMIVGDADSS